MQPGRDIAGTVLEYARRKNVTHILIGKSNRSRWFEMLYGSVVRDLMRDSGTISVTAVLAQGESVPAKSVATGDATDRRKLASIYSQHSGDCDHGRGGYGATRPFQPSS